MGKISGFRLDGNTFSAWRDQLQQRWQDLVQTNATPRHLAQAFALGTFISVLPTPGLNLVLVTLLTILCRQLPRVGLYAAVAVWNALVVAPFYALSHWVGEFLFRFLAVDVTQGWLSHLAGQFLLGNLVVAVSVTAVSYILVQAGITLYRAQRITLPVE